jgi:membrane protein implicated in regulation of membrane protease activity
MPFFGWLTVIPAVLISLLISNSFKTAIRFMAKSMDVSSESKVSELVGTVAEVNIPFKDGSTGEVTYVVHSKRYNAAARPFKPGTIFTRGSKVMIVDIKEDHTLLVEPYADILL